MSETTRKNIDTFWELIDEILNAILFILIGIERSIIVLITYMVVVFSISAQGLTIKKFLRKWGV